MRLKTIFILSVCAFALQLRAQETSPTAQLQQRLDAMQANFDRVVAAQRAEIDTLKQQVAEMRAAPPRPLLAETAAPASTSAPVITGKPWSPADSIRVGKGGTYMDASLVATFAVGGSSANDLGKLQLGGHDPNQRGFTVQGAELNLQGAVDTYFRGNANIVFLLNTGGETGVEVEEAWLETMSLPYNLQVRAGQYLTEFGRINTQHPHSWGFVDAPIVNGRLLGEDGMRNPGVRLSWLVPTPFYSELFFGVQNSQGGTAHSFRNDNGGEAFFGRLNGERGVKKFSDMLYSARYAASFEPTENQTLLSGLSAVFGPNNSGDNADTQIYGADVYWKWKSPRAHGGFPFVSWQTEALLRRYQAGAFNWDLNNDGILDAGEQDANGDTIPDVLARETVTDWGTYSQVLWGYKPGWVAGLRGDFVTGNQADYEKLYGADVSRAPRWRVSPNLTWYPSEFSKIRLQYNYDHREMVSVDHSLWLQFEFLLGAHAAHKF